MNKLAIVFTERTTEKEEGVEMTILTSISNVSSNNQAWFILLFFGYSWLLKYVRILLT